MIGLLTALVLFQQKTMLENQGFESGLAGWTTTGAVTVERKAPIDGRASIRLGPGSGSAHQRYSVPGLRVLWVGATLKPSAANVDAQLKLECFDRHGKRLLSQTAHPDHGKDPGIYLKTHAFTDHIVVSIEHTGEGSVLTDNVILTDDDKGRVQHPPQVDLIEAMRPIWKGREVSNESVLLLSAAGGQASGKLLFNPIRVLSVRDASLGTSYRQGQDFVVQGNRIIAQIGSSIPIMKDTEFAKGEFPWTRLDGRHVFVTYEHDDTWTGPLPMAQGDRLLRTISLLKTKRPITIVAFGDSITQGVNVSGFRNLPPYLPDWPTLAAGELKRDYANPNVRLYNVALGGQTSVWAKENARDLVATLNPDLVIVAFGMNDFWSLSPHDFRRNIQSVVATIRRRQPRCEFVLVASMRFDPAYTADPTYVGNLAGYTAELAQMQGPGIAFLDMDHMSQALYDMKSQRDLATDPMHPDDFMARWYAQALIATLEQQPAR